MSTVVKMVAKITGTRNGIDWPDIGETYELPDDEAAQLVTQKLAKVAKKDANTLQAANGIDHSTEIREANARARAARRETADLDEDDTETTALTTSKAGKG